MLAYYGFLSFPLPSLVSSFFFYLLLYNTLKKYLTIWFYLFNFAFEILMSHFIALDCSRTYYVGQADFQLLTITRSHLLNAKIISTNNYSHLAIFYFYFTFTEHTETFFLLQLLFVTFLRLHRIQLLKVISFTLYFLPTTSNRLNFRRSIDLVVLVAVLVWQWLGVIVTNSWHWWTNSCAPGWLVAHMSYPEPWEVGLVSV